MERGVRQGDLLSPYLSVVVVETLAITILQNTANNLHCIVQGERVDWGELRVFMSKTIEKYLVKIIFSKPGRKISENTGILKKRFCSKQMNMDYIEYIIRTLSITVNLKVILIVCLFVFVFLAESKMAIKEAMCFLLLVMSVVAEAEHSGKARSNIAIIIIECLDTIRVNAG